VSYVAVQRRTEIGVRLALGATPREICLLMLSGGMQPVLIGLAGGVLGSLAITRWIQALLFEVRPTDPGMISTAGLVLGLAALLACYVPARRACRLDASDALRQL
jgi:ABC-type lipoprotein release transport system permease subunit